MGRATWSTNPSKGRSHRVERHATVVAIMLEITAKTSRFICAVVLSACTAAQPPSTSLGSSVAPKPTAPHANDKRENGASLVKDEIETIREGREHGEAGAPLQVAAPAPSCSSPSWLPLALPPLLTRGTGRKSEVVGNTGVRQELFQGSCGDSPRDDLDANAAPVVVDGVRISLVRATHAGKSGRDWVGNQCQFEVALADGSGRSVLLGADRIPPFNRVNAVVRSGSAVWLGIGFNGYTREFPKGGNRVIALDLCDGRVVWQSKDSTSNGGLLLINDYLVSAYGFTSERRYVFVMDAYSGSVVQRLPVVENVCPSKSWAPNWHPGERCDAPGQVVGAANDPRIDDGLFVVDTNTGSATFEFVR